MHPDTKVHVMIPPDHAQSKFTLTLSREELQEADSHLQKASQALQKKKLPTTNSYNGQLLQRNYRTRNK